MLVIRSLESTYTYYEKKCKLFNPALSHFPSSTIISNVYSGTSPNPELRAYELS